MTMSTNRIKQIERIVDKVERDYDGKLNIAEATHELPLSLWMVNVL